MSTINPRSTYPRLELAKETSCLPAREYCEIVMSKMSSRMTFSASGGSEEDEIFRD